MMRTRHGCLLLLFVLLPAGCPPEQVQPRPYVPGNEVTLTADNFDAEVLESDVPVLVDFWADWCGPCKLMAPVLADISREQAGELKVGKVNVDEQPELAIRFNVDGIPRFILFEDGEVAAEISGAMPESDFREWVGDASGG